MSDNPYDSFYAGTKTFDRALRGPAQFHFLSFRLIGS